MTDYCTSERGQLLSFWGRVAAGSYPPAAPSYGRNMDFSVPPAQIPACPLGHGAPTSGV